MPNTVTPAHITIEVSGTKTKLIIDPTSYSTVDITDFAPRAVAGTPTFSTLGLYLDVGQDGFGHGFGEWEFDEPKSYAYTGQQIDTRHDYISLWTAYTTVLSEQSGLKINKLLVGGGVPVLATNSGLKVLRPSNDGLSSSTVLTAEVRDILSNGKYLFFSHSGRLKVGYLAQLTSYASNVLTFTNANFETTDMWADGSAWVFDGTGAGEEHDITASDSNTVTVTLSGTAPAADSYVLLLADTGNDGNPPNNYGPMCVFGGNCWAVEYNTNYIHFWGDITGSDAEGDGLSDAAVVIAGPYGYGITKMQPFQTQLFILRPEGVWVVNEQDADAIAYHTLDYTAEVSNDNFSLAIVWEGYLIYSIRNRVFKYRSGIQDITPPIYDEYPPHKMFGNFNGAVVRGKYLYTVGQSNSYDVDEVTEVISGFAGLLAHDGVGWHKIMDLPVDTPTDFDVWLDPTNDYLYVYAFDNVNKGHLWRVPLQSYTDLPYEDFPTSGEHNLYTSFYNFGMRRISKSYASVTLHGYFPEGTSVGVAYRLDDDGDWTALSTAFTSDMQEVDFPEEVIGKQVQLKLSLSTTDSSVSPIITAVILKAMMRPDVLYGVTCDVIVSDNLSDQNKLMGGHTAKEIKAALLAARDSKPPIQFTDLYGDTADAYLSSMRMNTIAYEDSDAVQAVARCTFVYV